MSHANSIFSFSSKEHKVPATKKLEVLARVHLEGPKYFMVKLEKVEQGQVRDWGFPREARLVATCAEVSPLCRSCTYGA